MRQQRLLLTQHDLRHAKGDHPHGPGSDDKVGIATCDLDRTQAELIVEPVEPAERTSDRCHAAIIVPDKAWIRIREGKASRCLLEMYLAQTMGQSPEAEL